jgi:hypothetical protein
MKLNFLKYRTNSYLKHNKASRASQPYKHAKQIGIIFTVEDRKKHDEIKEFIKKLEHEGKQVKVMQYLPKDKENYEFLFDFFTDKDLTFWGHITSDTANRFIEVPFDFLFYLDTTPNPLIMNLIARSKAKCRVGQFWQSSEPFFELMIGSNNGTRSLIDGIYKYTSLLK